MIRYRRPALAAALLAVAMLLAACGGEADGDAARATATATTPDSASAGAIGLNDPYPRFTDEASGLTAILGTPDLGAGPSRFSFVLTGPDGLVRLPVVAVTTYWHPEGEDGAREGPREEAIARFSEFPLGLRGLYVTHLDFDRAGTWSVEASVPTADGTTATVAMTFPVAAEPSAPAVGDPAPASEQRTLADVEDVHELSTGAEPDPALYRMTIAEALALERPLVVVFASPGFCTNALCGPQVEMLTDLRQRYGEQVTFLHVDIYENPIELRSDFDAAIRTPLLEEWGLHTDEWTFVIDASGSVAARFESFTPEPEVAAAIDAVLAGEAAAGAASATGAASTIER